MTKRLANRFPSAVLALILAGAGISAKPASAEASPAGPNILLIVSEDNGPELGCYGDPFAQTPNLDRLAAQGVRFENASVTYSVCSPSRSSFLTGLYTHQNGQIGLATHRFAMYDEDTPNIASLLKADGYRTGLVGKLHVNPESAFPFDFRRIPGANFDRANPMEEYAEAAAEFFEASDEPFFLSVNYPDAHLPFVRRKFGRPSEPVEAEDVRPLPWVGVDSERLRQVTADYYNCMNRLDEGVGLLLDELEKAGKSDDTLVIYIGDHGAQFPRGKGSVYEAGLRIPFIVRWKGEADPGLVRDELVSTVDILPTALMAAGADVPDSLPGLPLQALLREGEPESWRRYAFGFTTGSFPGNLCLRRSIRDERYKLILNLLPGTENLSAASYLDPSHRFFVVPGLLPEERATASAEVSAALDRYLNPPEIELYDLRQDPHEWNNLADDAGMAEIRERLLAALADFRRETRDPFLDPENVESFADEQLANRDLGYRRDENFRWDYLSRFPKWRESQ
ncbi:MAG: sulfatase [Verrucomicrobiales bacterium]